MNYSVVRWLTIPDTWNFTDSIIKENPENPINNSLEGACSISHWNVTEDIWNSTIKNIENIKVLIKSNNKYYSYQDDDFLEVDLTVENLEVYGMRLGQLINLTNSGEKIILAFDNPEIVTLVDSEVDLNLYMKGFKNVPKVEGIQNLELLINSNSEPKINTFLIPQSQLILPKGDIYFRLLDSVEDIQLIVNSTNAQNIKIIFSVDGGITWQTFNNNELLFEDIDIENLDLVREKGMTVATFNFVGEKWDEVITDDKIRFGYYFDIDNIEEIAQVDRLDATINMTGSWKNTEQGVDYNYGYGNEKILVKLYKDGGYKINYC